MHTTTRLPTVVSIAACCLIMGGATRALHAQEAVTPSPIPSDRVFGQLFQTAEVSRPAAPSLSATTAVSAAEETTATATPAPPRHVFASLYAGLIATQALDVHSTMRALDAGHVEANPVARWAVGNPATFVAFKAAATAGTIFLAERVRKKHPKRAIVLLAAIDSAYALVVAHNYRAPVPQR